MASWMGVGGAKLTVLRYRDLLQVEELFRRAKAVLRSRPIYHSEQIGVLVALVGWQAGPRAGLGPQPGYDRWDDWVS